MSRTRKLDRPDVLRAVGYRRASTAKQVQSGLGLEAQTEGIENRCEREGWELLKVIDDPAQHGTTPPEQRPGLSEALRMLREGEADVLVAHKIDRVCRSTFDLLSLMRQADDEGWRAVFNGFDLDPTTAVGKLMLTMLAAVAEFERDILSERTKEGLAIQREAGWPRGKPGKPHDRVPAETVTLIRDMRKDDMSWRKIADMLNEEGYPTGQRGIWHPMTCKRIAEDETR